MDFKTFTVHMVNTGKHLDVRADPEITVTVFSTSLGEAARKAEWQNPCFKTKHVIQNNL